MQQQNLWKLEWQVTVIYQEQECFALAEADINLVHYGIGRYEM